MARKSKSARLDATYSVVQQPDRVLDDHHGDRVTGHVFWVVKTPTFGEPTHYEVVASTLGEWCDCPGHSNHGHCKHIKMVVDHIEEQTNAKLGNVTPQDEA